MTRAAVGAMRFESPVNVTSGCRRRTTASMSPAARASISAPATSACISSATGGGVPRHRPSRPRRQLARRGVGHAQHRRDLAERHREAVVQHERHPLIGIQPLEHHHRGESRVLTGHHRRQRIVAVEGGHDGLGQPLAVIGLASVRGRAQPVQREPADHRRQPRPQIVDRRRLRSVPAQPRILHDVLGVGDGSGESVRDGQQMRPQFLELVDARTRRS